MRKDQLMKRSTVILTITILLFVVLTTACSSKEGAEPPEELLSYAPANTESTTKEATKETADETTNITTNETTNETTNDATNEAIKGTTNESTTKDTDTITNKDGLIMEDENKDSSETKKSLPTADTEEETDNQEPGNESPINTPTPLNDRILSSPSIIVKKSVRVLELWEGEIMYGSYPIALGSNPTGHKQKEGDGRTPEGTYFVCTRNNQSKFYLSLGVSYPNAEDAEAALEASFIDQATYEQIEYAIDNQQQPPWNTVMGGEIMIHGMGADSDWTAGCIAVDNEIMDILWRQCPIGTPIYIEP